MSQGPRVDNDSEALHRLEGIINQLRECFVEQREARFLTGSHNSVHKVVFESILDVLSNSEIESGRFGEMSAAACSSAVVTHVDRIFGWFQQTRMRCSVCGLEAERTILPKSKILTLLLKSSDRKDYTVTDLYLDSCVCTKDVMPCSKCEVCTNHEVASRVATTPELLLLWLDRGSGNETVSLDVEEDLMLPGLVSLRLVAVIHRARRHDGTGCYSCACRGSMDAWWYFEEGRALQPIKHSVSHVKPKLSCMLVYERIERPPQQRRRTETLLSAVRSPPVGTTLTGWLARALKRYPSWVDHLQLERIRHSCSSYVSAIFEGT